jgi:hypothetical protein
MTDPYANIRRALAMLESDDVYKRALGHATLRDQCHPDAIRALMTERDALAASASRWDMVCNMAEEGKLPSAVLMDTEHMGAGALQMHIDAAIAAANGDGNE